MAAAYRSRLLVGLLFITIGVVLIVNYMGALNRSGDSTINLPTPIDQPTVMPIDTDSPIDTATPISIAPVDTATPIVQASPTPQPTATIEVQPTDIIELDATDTPLVPTLIPVTVTPRPTAPPRPTSAPPIVLPGLYSTRDRFGLGVGYDERKSGRLTDLGPGFYLTWGMSTIPQSAGTVDFMPMVRIAQGQPRLDMSVYTNYAQTHPGSIWLIGNEPDVPWQDNSTPQEYASAYHSYYTAIKAADPTSRIAIAGISQPTALRLTYLEQVLTSYQKQFGEAMPIDIWNIHNFILNEERHSWGVDIPPGFSIDRGTIRSIEQHGSLKIFRQQIIDFRQWMASHGYRDKELIVSEYGILMPPDYGFDMARVKEFMLGSFDFFMTATDNSIGLPADGNRLVQRWCWFSLSDSNYTAGNLIDFTSGEINPLGQSFINYLQTH